MVAPSLHKGSDIAASSDIVRLVLRFAHPLRDLEGARAALEGKDQSFSLGMLYAATEQHKRVRAYRHVRLDRVVDGARDYLLATMLEPGVIRIVDSEGEHDVMARAIAYLGHRRIKVWNGGDPFSDRLDDEDAGWYKPLVFQEVYSIRDVERVTRETLEVRARRLDHEERKVISRAYFEQGENYDLTS